MKKVTIKDELTKDIRFVPLFAFQLAVPSIQSKRKKQYIEYLKINNIQLLQNLIEFWKINRYKHFYLYKLTFKKKYSVENLFDKLKINRYGHQEDNPIFEIIRSSLNKDVNDIYLYVKIRSPKKHFKSEDYVPPFGKIEIDHRKPYYLNAILHIDDSVLECRTCNFKKSKEIIDFLSEFIFKNELDFEQIIIDNSKLISADKNTKCKEATINGEWFGANQILITGDNVGRCLKEFADRRIDFLKEGITISERKNESEELLIVSDSDSGKISVKKVIENTADPYRYLKLKVGL